MTKLKTYAAVLSFCILILVALTIWDTAIYTGHVIKGEVVAYTPAGSSKSGFTPASIYVRLENGTPYRFQFSYNYHLSNRSLPTIGGCVEFKHYVRKYTQRNVYTFERIC